MINTFFILKIFPQLFHKHTNKNISLNSNNYSISFNYSLKIPITFNTFDFQENYSYFMKKNVFENVCLLLEYFQLRMVFFAKWKN